MSTNNLKIDYKLQEEEYIELIKLLKIIKVATTGGHAKIMVENGEVRRNGEIELRKRAKIRNGDKVQVANIFISVAK